MIRLIIWGMFLYLGWRAYQVFKDMAHKSGSPKVEGDSQEPKLNINEDDIVDADFKDIDSKE